MILLLFLTTLSLAQQSESKSPFLDQIKAGMPEEESESAGYSEKIKSKLDEKYIPPQSSDYTHQIKQSLEPIQTTDESYTDSIKQTLEPLEEMGAIEAVEKGQSELELKRTVDIKSALGLRVGVSVARSYTGESAAFSTVYPTAFSPEFMIHYEWKLFHSEWFGSLGVAAEAGLQSFRGFGIFKFTLTNPVTGVAFPTVSHVSTQLMVFPVLTGLVYRFNLLRIVRPFVQAGPMFLGLAETRSDRDQVTRSFSTGLYGTGGVSILLDGLNREMTWDLYAVHSVKHYYLTAEYFLALPLTGDVGISSQGIYAGFLMEM